MRLIRDEDLKEKEIAQRLKRNPNAVKAWIRRAREQLNDMLSEPPSTGPNKPKKARKKKNKGKEDKQ